MSLRRAALVAAAAGGIALGATALAGDPPPAAPRPRVALERLRARAVSPALAEVVEERLCAEIAAATGADVVCPGDVAAAALAARQAAILGECDTAECLRRVDAARAADRRVSGALERGDGGLVLSLEVAGEAGAGRAVEKLPGDLEALLSRLPGVVRKLFPQR